MSSAFAYPQISTPSKPRLGLLTHVSGNGDPARILRDTIELFVVAEQLGFHSAWVAQHHVRAENGVLPSPFVFLAAAAERTSRLRLGTGVVILPLEDPIRVAEDAAVADLLSSGRLELGLGTGGDASTYAAFSQDFDRRRERHRQGRHAVASALSGIALAGETPLHPLAPGLADRIWWATGSADSAAEAGSDGRGLLLARSSPNREASVGNIQIELIDAYHRHYNHATGRAPKIGITRSIYPARNRAEAIDALEQGTRTWSARLLPEGGWRDMDADTLFARHNILWGAPEDIVATLSDDRALPHATDILIQVQPGEPGFARTVRALTTIALEIAPALGWHTVSA